MIKKRNHARYFFIAALIGLVILSFFLIKPFLMPILGAIVISYIFYPVYKWLNKYIKYKPFCSALMTVLIVALIVVPLFFLTNMLMGEAIGFYDGIREAGALSTLNNWSSYISNKIGFHIETKEIIQQAGNYMVRSLSGFVVGISNKLIGFFVMVLLIYYFLKDGAILGRNFRDIIPMTKKRKNELVKRFKDVINATVYGTIITGIIQGAIGGLGLWLFGVQSPIVWTIVMIILSILPVVGPPLVWFPIAVWLMFVKGDWFNGVGLLVYGFFIVSTIDNLVRPKLISTKVSMHPALILVGVLGGLVMFGVLGIILGPMIFAILDVFIGFYRREHVSKS